MDFDLDNLERKIKQKLYSTKEKQAFLRDVFTLVDDGVPANKAIEAVGTIATGNNRTVAAEIMAKIAEGKPIADGMVGWFPSQIVELIRAGESGGSLAPTLQSAADALSKSNESTGSIISNMMYPTVVIAIGLGVLLYINGSVFVQFAEIKPIAEWPNIGQRLVKLANFISGWWMIVLGGFVLLIISIRKLLTTYVGELRTYIDKIPLLSLYKVTTAARFMETLGLLVANGVVFKKALGLMRMQASPYLSYHLMLMERRLGEGIGNIADVLDTGMIDKTDIVRLRVTAASKGFDHALVRLGKNAADRAFKTVDLSAKITGGIFLALGAALAGSLVMAIYAVGSSLAGT